jgi:hypothetical protein
MILVVSFARSSGLIKKYWYLSLSSRRVYVFHLLVEVSAGILISASFKSRKYPHDFFFILWLASRLQFCTVQKRKPDSCCTGIGQEKTGGTDQAARSNIKRTTVDNLNIQCRILNI